MASNIVFVASFSLSNALQFNFDMYIVQNLSKLLGKHVTQSRVEALIKEADTTGDGRISFEEFLNMFRHSRVEALIKEADTTGDGRISFDEFLNMFQHDNSKQVAMVLEG